MNQLSITYLGPVNGYFNRFTALCLQISPEYNIDRGVLPLFYDCHELYLPAATGAGVAAGQFTFTIMRNNNNYNNNNDNVMTIMIQISVKVIS